MDKSAQVSTSAVKTTAQKTAVTPAAKQVMERARRKAQTAAQRSMLQKSKQTAKAAAELSRKAAVAVTKAAAALVSALVSLVGGVVLVAALAVMAKEYTARPPSPRGEPNKLVKCSLHRAMRCFAVEQPGKITLEATGKGLKKGTLIIESCQEAKK